MNKNIPALNSALRRIEPGFSLSVRPHVPKPIADLLTRCTAFRPSDRPGFGEIKNDAMAIWVSLGGSAYRTSDSDFARTTSEYITDGSSSSRIRVEIHC